MSKKLWEWWKSIESDMKDPYHLRVQGHRGFDYDSDIIIRRKDRSGVDKKDHVFIEICNIEVEIMYSTERGYVTIIIEDNWDDTMTVNLGHAALVLLSMCSTIKHMRSREGDRKSNKPKRDHTEENHPANYKP